MNKFNLVKDKWTSADINNFCKYISAFSNTINAEFTKRVYNTQKECLAVKVPILRGFAQEILKGNFLTFIASCHSNIIELNLLKGMLICKTNNYNLKIKLLEEYAQLCDSWVETDIIKFKILKGEEQQYFDKIKVFLTSEYVFVRRLAFVLFFNFINNDCYIDEIFDEIIKLQHEKEYYVNMSIAWLLCECFIKQRNKTINFIQNNINKLNDFVINKFVSKCNDSLRIKEEDKIYLKLLKNNK